ncbi:hypothetical protein HDU80_010288 [Chytriomyces hyalinus]|nr:hypothetical protein HDU80_010286 [Chytriomyces hyalinus]KAJ3395574.1 hypothetical protein HDU80_010288 [Chytriomyces hyalinus]
MAEAEPRLPEYFPLKLKKCTDVSESFFGCFDFNTIPNGDKDVGRQALIKCGDQLKLYKECMDRFRPVTEALAIKDKKA